MPIDTKPTQQKTALLNMVQLIVPTEEYLPSYTSALRRGWSPNNERGLAAAIEELEQIETNPAAFVASLDDRAGTGAPVKMPDGSVVPRLPGFRRWLWDGEVAGSIGFRWQHGTVALPPYCLGHIGYSVVPWKQRRGYVTSALVSLLEEARKLKLPYVEITTDPDNLPSQKVILAAALMPRALHQGIGNGLGCYKKYLFLLPVIQAVEKSLNNSRNPRPT